MLHGVSLVPHAVCWAGAPRLIWTMVITNAITFLSYVSICATLLWLTRRTRRVIARDWGYFLVGFALFIVACGSTHLLEVITTWTPIFWVDAWTNVLTAVLSAYVAIMLVRRTGAIGFGVNDYARRLGNTELEKRQMQQSLVAAQRLEDWSRMSTVLAHEISNPMEAIQNVLYLIRTSADVPAEVARMTQMATEEAARVVEISRSTLTFFRQAAEPEMVDLLGVAESVRFLVAPLLRERALQLEVQATGNVTVEAFPGETRQVLLNLVRNACEATTKMGAQVRVELNAKADGVEMVVADEGSGMDAAVLETLFRFGASTKGDKGNGMGLWTVKHIVTRHGGTVRVESKPGQGTRFVLWWPKRFVREPELMLAPQAALA